MFGAARPRQRWGSSKTVALTASTKSVGAARGWLALPGTPALAGRASLARSPAAQPTRGNLFARRFDHRQVDDLHVARPGRACAAAGGGDADGCAGPIVAKDRCRVGRLWVTAAPEKHVLFDYSKRHDGEAVDAVLSGYKLEPSAYSSASCQAGPSTSPSTSPQHIGARPSRTARLNKPSKLTSSGGSSWPQPSLPIARKNYSRPAPPSATGQTEHFADVLASCPPSARASAANHAIEGLGRDQVVVPERRQTAGVEPRLAAILSVTRQQFA